MKHLLTLYLCLFGSLLVGKSQEFGQIEAGEFINSVRYKQFLISQRQNKPGYLVYFKNDSLAAGDIVPNASGQSLQFITAEGRTLVLPSQAKAIYKFSNDDLKLAASPYRDSVWLYKTQDGAVTAFSVYGQPPKKVFGVYVNDDLVPVTKEQLAELVAQDPKALRWVQRRQFYKAIQLFNKNNPSQ